MHNLAVSFSWSIFPAKLSLNVCLEAITSEYVFKLLVKKEILVDGKRENW